MNDMNQANHVQTNKSVVVLVVIFGGVGGSGCSVGGVGGNGGSVISLQAHPLS